MMKLSWAVLLVVVIMAWSSSPFAKAQDAPKCAEELGPCGPFINSTTTTPPATCCNPLKQVLKNELPCICDIFSNVELIQTFSLNVTEALTLPKRCGIKFDIVSECEALLAPAKAPAPGPGQANAASNISSIGSVFGLFLLLTTLMFY